MSNKSAISALLIAAQASVDTLKTKYDAAIAKVANLQAKLDNFDALAALTTGSPVLVSVGRGENKIIVEGVITAVKPGEVSVNEETGEETVGERLFKVKYSRTGDDFDAEFGTFYEGKVGLPGTAAGAEEEDEAAAE